MNSRRLATPYSSGAVDKMSWKERLFKKDSTSFKKYIESTTAHGVVRIFTGKSITRRLFWLVIVLAAACGCLYNISDRISFLVSAPTSTTISISRRSNVTFPAVTVCNLNRFRLDELRERNLSDFIRSAFDIVAQDVDQEECRTILDNLTSSGFITVPAHEVGYEEFTVNTRNILEEFILECYFAGRKCNVTEVFEPVFTSLGICYTFNLGRLIEIQMAKGTGQRQGLTLFINVQWLNYVTANDAGVKIAIHSQSEPPMPDDQGIGVPTGRNAFISIKELRVVDNTGRNCKSSTSDLNFLRGEYTTYSQSACLVDCMQTSLSDKCACVDSWSFYSPDSSEYAKLSNCTLKDICCITEEFILPDQCNCEDACSSSIYLSTASYSYFPSDYLSSHFDTVHNISVDQHPSNLLAVNIYFETLNIETRTTSNAYSFVALLSDIGGQLGLFLGVSVISIMEFGTWIIDEIKDRVFGMSEKKLKKKCHLCCRARTQKTTVPIESESLDGKELNKLT